VRVCVCACVRVCVCACVRVCVCACVHAWPVLSVWQVSAAWGAFGVGIWAALAPKYPAVDLAKVRHDRIQ
jgi:hypothetical protein